MPCLLGKLHIYYCIQNRQLLDPIWSQMNPVHTLTPYFLNTHFNIILHLQRLSRQLSPVHFLSKILYIFLMQAHLCFSSLLCYMLCPSHPCWLHHTNNIWWGCKLQSNFLCPPVTSSLLFPDILLSTLFSNALSFCSLTVRHQHSHLCKTTVLIFRCLETRQ
jgi:hypothetical protein